MTLDLEHTDEREREAYQRGLREGRQVGITMLEDCIRLFLGRRDDLCAFCAMKLRLIVSDAANRMRAPIVPPKKPEPEPEHEC